MTLTELGSPTHYDDAGKSRYYDQRFVFQGMHHKLMGTNTVKVLEKGTVNDIELEFPFLGYSGLEKYVRLNWGSTDTPVYVFDDHNHALFAWMEAYKEGRITKGAMLLHFDSHPDDEAGRGGLSLEGPVELVARYAKALEISEFIEPAERAGLIGNSRWIYDQVQGRIPSALISYPLHSLPVHDHSIEQVASYLQNRPFDPKSLIVDIDVDYFPWEENIRDSRAIEVMKQAMSVAGVVTIATSPGYIPPQRAIGLVRDLLAA